MKKNLALLFFMICIVAFSGLFAALQVSAAEIGDLYYFDGDNFYFDLNSMKHVYSSSGEADIRFGSSGSANYLIGLNGAAIKDMGAVNYEGTEVPASGYSSERIAVEQDHTYAVRCGNGSYGIIKITGYDSENGIAEFMARLAEPEKKPDLYYLNGDSLRFDLETMRSMLNSKESDIYFRFVNTALVGENGAAIKDLGVIDYASAKAPLFGYSTGDIKIVKNHVYAVRSGSKGLYIIKVTNVVSDSDFEFMARKAEQGFPTPTPTPVPMPLPLPTPTLTPTPVPTPIPTPSPVQTRKEDLYWVENGTRFVLGGNILFEDSNDIMYPFLSPDKKYVVYSNGSYELLMYDIAKKTVKRIYEEEELGYRVYPVGWSQDGKQVAFKTSYYGGFIGGNKLCILNLSDKKVSVVAKGLSSADWGKNGMFAISNGTEVWLVDQQGRNKVTLTVPTARAFFGADDVSFTPDCTKVIYIVADKYYLHDIKANTYEELAIPEEATQNGTVHAGTNGRIAVIENRKIYIYDPSNKNYSLLYEGADSAYPNWAESAVNEVEIDLLAIPFKGTVILDWRAKNTLDIGGYHVYRAKEPGKYTVPLTSAPIFKREFVDDKAEAGVQYYYVVKAVLPGNKMSKPSNEAAVMIKKEDPTNNPVSNGGNTPVTKDEI